MATKSATLRTLLTAVNDAGEEPEKSLDESFVLASFTDFTPGRRIRLAAAAADQAVTFTDAIALLVVSHDYPFSLRLAAAETLLENLRSFLVWADDEDSGVHQTSVLLTGNGTNVADLEVWIIEKPA